MIFAVLGEYFLKNRLEPILKLSALLRDSFLCASFCFLLLPFEWKR